MKENTNIPKDAKKDRVYNVNENQQDSKKDRANADPQQQARQQSSDQQGDGHTSIGVGQTNERNTTRDGQQGDHSDNRPRAQNKPQQR